MSIHNPSDEFDLPEIPGLDEAQARAEELRSQVPDIYIEREGDNVCEGGACSI